MRHTLVLALVLIAVPTPGICGPISYFLRDAHFFGGTPGSSREITQSGAFTSASAEALPFVFSTGGATPTLFTALASNQGTPFALGVSNTVSAAADTALTFNIAPFGPTAFVSLVQSRILEQGVVVTGSTGVGYLIPQFQIEGTFEDGHASAFGQLGICAGIAACTATGLGNSTGGTQQVNLPFSPSVGANTQFTFGTPFSFFFFVSAGVSSMTTGTLAPGDVSMDAQLRLLGFKVVDQNGVDIPGTTVHSDLLPEVPEPATLLLVAPGVIAVVRRRRRQRETQVSGAHPAA